MYSYRSTFLIFSLTLFCSSLNSQPVEETGLTDEKLANSINAFGCNLLHGLYEEVPPEGNIFVSPIGVYTALALLHLGAGEKTRKDLEAVLKVTNSTDNVHEKLSSILTKLTSSSGFRGVFHETLFANGIFLQDGFPIKDTYLASARKYYQVSAQNVDFGKSQEATDQINRWVSDHTKGRIPKLYEAPLTPDHVAVILSTVYFNAEWRNRFPLEKTQKEKFKTSSGEIEVPMMNSINSIEYVRDDALHYDSVSLPYSGKEYAMNIYLQHEGHGDHGSLADLFHKLAESHFNASYSLLNVDLKLPKMKFSFKKSLVDALKLKSIFAEPDLSALTEKNQLKISDMKHASEIEVDEKGTIATATTAIEAVLYSLFVPPNPEPIKFYVNRPYIATIVHQPTKALLFAGIIRKPI